jgi:membrane-bound lytic murein transglycosylase D
MDAGRPILAAVGLFFGGLLVGSSPGGTREGSAHAATTSGPEARADGRSRAERGSVSPALRKIAIRRDADADIEPPAWSARGGASRSRGDGRSSGRGHDDPDDPLAGLKMPDVPIPRNAQVLKYIRYFSESHEGRKTFAEALRRSGRFQEIIAHAFRERGLPQDLVAVALVESGFSTEALSTAGAAGLWQFMPATARAYGLAIETTIDERVSIWRSTEAAAHHLADLYERFRSWELALAAYNLGYDGLERRLDDYEADDFWTLAEMPGALPKETEHYVPKVLAAAVVLANIDELGFSDVERAAPIDASELEVAAGTKLATVARAAGTSLRLLRELNPELVSDIIPDRGATSTIHVPRGGLARARVMLPKLAADTTEAPRVSDDFDWGKDDIRSGRSRLERASAHVIEPRPAGGRRTRRRGSGVAAAAEPNTVSEPKAKQLPQLPGPDSENARASESVRANESARASEATAREATARVLYRVTAGDAIQQIAMTVGLTVDQVLAQAHVTSAAEIKVGTLLDLRVPSNGITPRDR